MKGKAHFCCILVFAIFFHCSLYAQDWRWKSYLAYYNTTLVAEANNNVFAVADGSLYCYNKEDQSLQTYSRLNGLSDVTITQLGYNSDVNTLLLVYDNGNIDLWGDDGIYNLPFLKNSTTVQEKTVNSYFFNNEYAYIAAQFGIMVVNMQKKEVTDTYRIGAVSSCCILSDSLYAVTGDGLRRGALSDNLLDSGNWEDYSLPDASFSGSEIESIASFQNTLCFYVPNNGIHYLSGNTVRRFINNAGIKAMKVESDKLLAYTNGLIYIASSFSTPDQITGLSTVQDVSTLKNNAYWIANATGGILGIQKQGSTYSIILEQTSIDGPKRNMPYFMTFEGDQLLVTGGGRWTDRDNNPATFMRYRDGAWTSIDEDALASQAGLSCADFMCAVVDPADTSHYFVASYGEGLFEFRGMEFQAVYNINNSPLQSASSSFEPMHYVRISGLDYDANGNLWILCSNVNAALQVLQSDGTWTTYSNLPISNSSTTDKLLVMSNGLIVADMARATNAGIFILDNNGTLDASDDVSSLYTSLTNTQGESLSASEFYCIAEDKDGSLWVGTNIGPVIGYSTSDGYRFNRIVLADESDYLLNGEQINAIAIDGGNRKWLGTENSGIFLVSEDGTEVLENFTVDNSVLFSNCIESIAINQETGEVFIGTDKGIISYQGDTTEGSDDYSNIHAYPNPVRPDFNGNVVITGLMDQSEVKITDLAGNLIYKAISTGGQVSWNCRNGQGRRVATGIYLVLAATPNAEESVVTKIMVVK